MAEGDSVFRMARRVEGAFDGRTIESVESPNPRSGLRGSGERLVGEALESAETRGKHLILNFTGGLSLHAHMGMSGGWYAYRLGEPWRRPRKTAWVVFGLGGMDVVQFGGPTLRLVRKVELGRDARLSRLGPDLLDPGFTVEAGAGSLAAAGPVELGEALLNQRLLAGIGNIFKSESCWAAKLDPWRPVDSFEPAELELVVDIAQKQLQHGAETGHRPGRIYKMAGRPCPRCRTLVKSQGQGDDNRITYWCPTCQKR
ncbi:MAG: DNA-formamidopyrimidine glycosylase family protein [Solirubrobacterales bacterium]